MASLDTNVLVRLVIADIPAQTKAATELLVSGEEFQIADVALIELVYVLESYYDFERKQIVTALESLLGQTNFNCNRIVFHKALPHYLKFPKLSFTDCALTAYAELSNATPLLTFDKKLAQQLQHAELLGP